MLVSNNIKNSSKSGVSGIICDNLTIKSNSILDNTINDSYGTDIYIDELNNEVIFNNTIFNTVSHRIYINFINNSNLTKNILEKNNGYGIYIFESYSTKVPYNFIKGI